MQMTNGEVVMNVMQAKDQRGQITICADLNCCSEEKIKDILKANDIDLRTLRGAVHKRVVETKKHASHKAPVKQSTQDKVAAAFTVLLERKCKLCEQRDTLMAQLKIIEDELEAFKIYEDKLAGRGESDESSEA